MTDSLGLVALDLFVLLLDLVVQLDDTLGQLKSVSERKKGLKN